MRWRGERCYNPSGVTSAGDRSTWTMEERVAVYLVALETEMAHRNCRPWMPCCNGDSEAAGRRAAEEKVREMRKSVKP